MLAALRLVRGGNVGVSFVGTIVGALVARASGVSAPLAFWEFALLAGLSTAFVTGGGNVLNDLLDIEGDRTNHPDRPLVTGEVTARGGRWLATGLFVLGAVVALPVVWAEPWVGVILAVAVASLLGYEFRLKSRGLAGNGIVALLTALVFLYGGAAAGDAILLLPFAAMAFFATLSRELIKDMEDVEGDVGRTTLPKSHGPVAATRAARASVGVAVALSVVPFLWFVAPGSVAGIIYLLLVAAADATSVLSIFHLPERLHFEQTTSKAAMTVALFAFLAVAFR
ncbi:MAG TPA: geranylgeranylglycerol-phosphate geranylgeranyltransferase [Thermoplasmata archaeon]|nr:geranylgeranylglycerol-phosphate geranylgeranyltransferase [Thermoplasmata archaeon]